MTDDIPESLKTKRKPKKKEESPQEVVRTFKGRDPGEVLSEVWGYDEFRENQREAIDLILEGKTDVLYLARTGSGKTCVYCVPALIKEGVAVVISPLLALMQDQIASLKEKNLRVATINSEQGIKEKRDVFNKILKKELDILMISPETLIGDKFFSWFKANIKPSFIAFDEAHCFVGETLVSTNKGLISFEELDKRISEGESIQAYSKNSDGRLEYKPINKVFKNPFKQLVQINLDDRNNFLSTEDHIVFTNKGEVRVGDLSLKHRLVSFENGVVTYIDIQSIVHSTQKRDCLYDMEVADNHNYFIGDVPVLVHNCISQYGSDFRPKYKKCSILRKVFDCPVVALTATADKATVADMKETLGFSTTSKFAFQEFTQNFDRPSIHYHILKKSKTAPLNQLIDLINERDSEETGIVYCSTRKQCADVAYALYTRGFRAKAYHAGMNKGDKAQVLTDWLEGSVKIVCCTTAFGLGIDKADVRYVINYTIPSSIEDLAQMWGRASRDGLPSDAYLLYDPQDVNKMQFILRQSTTSQLALKHKLDKLNDVNSLARSERCIRGQLLQYFGQRYVKHSCDSCSVCVDSITL